MNCNGLFCKNTWPAITDIPVTVCLCLAWYVKKANNNISHKHYDHPKVLCHCCINLQLSSNKLTLAKYVCLSNVALAHRPTTALISELQKNKMTSLFHIQIIWLIFTQHSTGATSSQHRHVSCSSNSDCSWRSSTPQTTLMTNGYKLFHKHTSAI